MNPASRPRAAHAASDRRSRVAAHSHVNAATAAIDGACVMVGSFTRYHAMNEPQTATATAAPASFAGKKIRVSRNANQQPSKP